jgi:2-methylcitrate dehydratase PrpD
MQVTQKWVDFTVGLTFERVPGEVVRQTKMFILDSIGCALSGYALAWGKRVADVGRDLGGKAEATVLGSGDRLHCTHAAYVNGKLANILDFDETLYNNRHIGGVPVFPALSVGERVGASGKDIILATLLGYDFAARAGLCGSSFRPDPKNGVVVAGSAGMGFNTFGSAISAARTLNFGQPEMLNTLGTVGYFATGAIESKFVFTPPSNFNKYGDMGWFCMSGVMAAICARNGYVGDPSILDGPRGLAALLGAPEFDFETFTMDLGERWYIMDAGFKPYPTCRWFHTAIRMLEKIMDENLLKPGDIVGIVVNTHPLAITLPTFQAGDRWADSGRELWLSVDSLPFAMACAVLGIPPGPDWGTEETLKSAEVAEISRKVVHGEHPGAMQMTAAWKGHPGKLFSQPPTSIQVITGKGTFTAESADIPGDSWNPRARMTEDEIIEKFRRNASPTLAGARVDRIIEKILGLERVKDIGELMGLLSG